MAKTSSAPAQAIMKDYLNMEEKNMLSFGCKSRCARRCTSDPQSYERCSKRFMSMEMYWIEEQCGCNKGFDVKMIRN